MRDTTLGGRKLTRVGLVSLACGLILMLSVSVMNRRAIWFPLVADLPLVAGESVEFEFSPARNGYHELQIEVDDTMGKADRLRYLTDWKAPSELDIDWVVESGAEVVAAGDAADFLFIEEGPASVLSRLRRTFLRMPYGQNAKHWMTLGLAGSVTSSRGVGRFEAVAGTRYTIRVTPASAYPLMTSHGVRIVVRPDRKFWLAHFAKTGPLAHLGLLALGLGGALVALGEFRRRIPGADGSRGR